MTDIITKAFCKKHLVKIGSYIIIKPLTPEPIPPPPPPSSLTIKISGVNRAVYTRENKPRLTLAAAYIIRERNYLWEYKLPGQDNPRLEKAVNVDFVPFIRGDCVLCKPRPD